MVEGISYQSGDGEDPEKPGSDGRESDSEVPLWETGGLLFSLAVKRHG